MALMAWADRVFYDGKPISFYLCHVPNGGKRNAREAGRMKRMGVKAGYPDYILDVMRPDGHGLMFGGMRLELKAPRETLGRAPTTTACQFEQLSRLSLSGYYCQKAEGWIEAAVRICEYLGLPTRGLPEVRR